LDTCCREEGSACNRIYIFIARPLPGLDKKQNDAAGAKKNIVRHCGHLPAQLLAASFWKDWQRPARDGYQFLTACAAKWLNPDALSRDERNEHRRWS
jgi:hypothetical protein